MESEGSFPCSQEPTIGPYPEPDESSPHLPKLFPSDLFYCFPPIYAYVFQIVSSLRFFKYVVKYSFHKRSTNFKNLFCTKQITHSTNIISVSIKLYFNIQYISFIGKQHNVRWQLWQHSNNTRTRPKLFVTFLVQLMQRSYWREIFSCLPFVRLQVFNPVSRLKME
jgi:hypothetical protein